MFRQQALHAWTERSCLEELPLERIGMSKPVHSASLSARCMALTEASALVHVALGCVRVCVRACVRGWGFPYPVCLNPGGALLGRESRILHTGLSFG